MPLLDHFHPPLSRTHSWRSLHGTWAVAIARTLNQGILPPGYIAAPFVDHDGPVEIDVAAWHGPGSTPDSPGPWSPAAPGIVVAIDPPAVDSARVEVLTDDGDPRLAAAIEIVSPRNKNRPTARAAFAAKCAGYLQRGCGLIVIDVVTTRRADWHAGILEAMGAAEVVPGIGGLSAAAYRANAAATLEAWPAALAVGRPLPTLPLWLAADLAVPLDLELGYTAACDDLRVRPV